MSEIKTAEQRIHKLEGGEGDSFVTVEQALIAERDELRKALADRDAKLAALEKQEPVAEVMLSEGEKIIDASMAFFDISPVGTKLFAAAGAAPVPSELVLTFNFGTLVKVVFQDRVLYEVDLSSKSYWQVCWAHGWAGDYDSEEEARNECLSFCGYGRSIREVKPGDDGYKNPRQPKLTERRIPIYAAASTAPVHEGWQLVPIEPTDAMLVSARDWSYAKYGKPIGNAAAVGCWEAMLSAASKDARTKETK